MIAGLPLGVVHSAISCELSVRLAHVVERREAAMWPALRRASQVIGSQQGVTFLTTDETSVRAVRALTDRRSGIGNQSSILPHSPRIQSKRHGSEAVPSGLSTAGADRSLGVSRDCVTTARPGSCLNPSSQMRAPRHLSAAALEEPRRIQTSMNTKTPPAESDPA
jgi:hypothetical protein